ncbi:MAG: response regulator, partial [Deltaproteobacteria bacterium]|nr:response regulator [Deltaproteobacteria bacterium]
MDTAEILKGKMVLVVDDEVDVTDTVAELLDMCFVLKANDYDTACQLLLSYTFDVVILDIMGVNGFELLKLSVKRGFPAVMLTAHALTPESLEKSIKLGAVSFLPKEKMV